jgi:hypothetical protein
MTRINRRSFLKASLGSVACGGKLFYDAPSETCPGDAEANGLLRRSYRAPFVVPDHV